MSPAHVARFKCYLEYQILFLLFGEGLGTNLKQHGVIPGHINTKKVLTPSDLDGIYIYVSANSLLEELVKALFHTTISYNDTAMTEECLYGRQWH